MDTDAGLIATKRRVDEWLGARPRATALVYFVVLTAMWASAEFFLGGGTLTRAVLFGGLFASIYVALMWFWGNLGDEAEE